MHGAITAQLTHQQGAPLNVLQELGGWSDYEMVRKYAHLSVEHLAEHADKLSQTKLVSTNLAQPGNEKQKSGPICVVTA